MRRTRSSKLILRAAFLILLILFSKDLTALSFDGLITIGPLEYRGATERNGYLLGLNTNIFLFSDLALALRGNVIDLDSGLYKEREYASTAKIINFSAGLLYIVDTMTLIPFIRADAEFYSGNFTNKENMDYGYSIGAGVRYEREILIFMFELAYKQLYKTTTAWPSIILFTINIGFSTDRKDNKEADI